MPPNLSNSIDTQSKHPQQVMWGRDTYHDYIGENVFGNPVYESNNGNTRVAFHELSGPGSEKKMYGKDDYKSSGVGFFDENAPSIYDTQIEHQNKVSEQKKRMTEYYERGKTATNANPAPPQDNAIPQQEKTAEQDVNSTRTPIPEKKILIGSNGNKYPNRVMYGKDSFQAFIGENVNGDPVYASEDGTKRVAGAHKTGKLIRDDNFNIENISITSRTTASVIYTADEVDAEIKKSGLSRQVDNSNQDNTMSQEQDVDYQQQGYDDYSNNSFSDGPPSYFSEMNDSYEDSVQNNYDPMDDYSNPGDANFDPTGVLDDRRSRAANNLQDQAFAQALNNQVQGQPPIDNQTQNQPQDQPQPQAVADDIDFGEDPYSNIDDAAQHSNTQHLASQPTIEIRDSEGNVIGVTTIAPNAADNAPIDPAELAELERQMHDGDNLSRLYNRMEFMESLRLSTGVNEHEAFHKNMASKDAHEHLEKIRDGILDMTNKGLINSKDADVANNFVSGMISEVEDNPAGSLELALMSDTVITDADFNSPETKASIVSFRNSVAGKEDALLASLHLVDIKSKGEYPFAIGALDKAPISSVLDPKIIEPLDSFSMIGDGAMRDFIEVKFAYENFDGLSSEYLNGVTKDQLTKSLDDYSNNGFFKKVRESNRYLEKTAAEHPLFSINGVAISNPEAIDSIISLNESTGEGRGPFSENTSNPQNDIINIVNANKAIAYQLENSSFLPKGLSAPYSNQTISNTLQTLNDNQPIRKLSQQLEAIEQYGMTKGEWESISTHQKISAANASGGLDLDATREKLAFHIKNHDQLGNFSDKLDERGQANHFPSQSEMRWALRNLDEISQTSIDPESVPRLHQLNPPADNDGFTEDINFTQSDADNMFVIIDTQLERVGMTDQDILDLEDLSLIIQNKGFVKGSDYEAKSSLRLDGVAEVHGRTLMEAQRNSLSSHRAHTSNGVAAKLGAGADVSNQQAAGNAYNNAIDKISNLIIDGVVGDSNPKHTATDIQNVLSSPELQAASAKLTPQDALNNAKLHANGGNPDTIDNTTDAIDNTASSNDNDTSADNSTADGNDASVDSNNSSEKERTPDGKKDKNGRSPDDPDYEGDEKGRKQPSTALPPKPQGGDYLTGGSAIVAALGALTAGVLKAGLSMRGAIEPPPLSSYAKNPDGSDVDLSRGSKLNPNTKNHLVKMQSSMLSFESSSKLLEDNKITNTLSMQDKRLLEKDLKKQLSIFTDSSMLASEGLKISAPDMSSRLRLDVSNHLEKSSSDMKKLFDNSQDKGLFAANDRQKEMMQNAMSQIGNAVSSLKNSFVVGIKALFSPSRD